MHFNCYDDNNIFSVRGDDAHLYPYERRVIIS